MLRIVAWLTLITGCYTPRFPEGAPCTSDVQCPAPQRCFIDECLMSPPGAADAGVDPADAASDAAIDAAVDAPADAAVDAAVVCDTTDLACAGGVLTILSCPGSCRVRCTARTARQAAANACDVWRGHLLEIEDDAEQQCVATAIERARTWIGLVQPAAPQATPADGWTWNGTRPVDFSRDFTAWLPGKPDDGTGGDGGEQCAEMTANPGAPWDDVECATGLTFVCER